MEFQIRRHGYRLPAFYKYDGDQFRYAVYRPGIKMYAGEGAKVIAEYHKAYCNREWDGFHGYFHMLPEKATGHAMAAVNGKVAHIAFNLFDAYNRKSYIAHKKLFKKCLDEIGFVPTIEADLPSTARVTLTESEENTLLHVKITYAESRGDSLCIEEHGKYPAAARVTVKGKFTDAMILPSYEKADAVIGDNSTTITLPQINGYICIALKKA